MNLSWPRNITVMSRVWQLLSGGSRSSFKQKHPGPGNMLAAENNENSEDHTLADSETDPDIMQKAGIETGSGQKLTASLGQIQNDGNEADLTVNLTLDVKFDSKGTETDDLANSPADALDDLNEENLTPARNTRSDQSLTETETGLDIILTEGTNDGSKVLPISDSKTDFDKPLTEDSVANLGLNWNAKTAIDPDGKLTLATNAGLIESKNSDDGITLDVDTTDSDTADTTSSEGDMIPNAESYPNVSNGIETNLSLKASAGFNNDQDTNLTAGKNSNEMLKECTKRECDVNLRSGRTTAIDKMHNAGIQTDQDNPTKSSETHPDIQRTADIETNHSQLLIEDSIADHEVNPPADTSTDHDKRQTTGSKICSQKLLSTAITTDTGMDLTGNFNINCEQRVIYYIKTEPDKLLSKENKAVLGIKLTADTGNYPDTSLTAETSPSPMLSEDSKIGEVADPKADNETDSGKPLITTDTKSDLHQTQAAAITSDFDMKEAGDTSDDPGTYLTPDSETDSDKLLNGSANDVLDTNMTSGANTNSEKMLSACTKTYKEKPLAANTVKDLDKEVTPNIETDCGDKLTVDSESRRDTMQIATTITKAELSTTLYKGKETETDQDIELISGTCTKADQTSTTGPENDTEKLLISGATTNLGHMATCDTVADSDKALPADTKPDLGNMVNADSKSGLDKNVVAEMTTEADPMLTDDTQSDLNRDMTADSPSNHDKVLGEVPKKDADKMVTANFLTDCDNILIYDIRRKSVKDLLTGNRKTEDMKLMDIMKCTSITFIDAGTKNGLIMTDTTAKLDLSPKRASKIGQGKDETMDTERSTLEDLNALGRLHLRPSEMVVYTLLNHNQPSAQAGLPSPEMNEESRLRTFVNFPAEAGQFPCGLAANGFVYIGTGGQNDRVKCCFCQAEKEGWRSSDNITDVHKALSPHCPMVTGSECGNVPMAERNGPSVPHDGDGSTSQSGQGGDLAAFRYKVMSLCQPDVRTEEDNILLPIRFKNEENKNNVSLEELGIMRILPNTGGFEMMTTSASMPGIQQDDGACGGGISSNYSPQHGMSKQCPTCGFHANDLRSGEKVVQHALHCPSCPDLRRVVGEFFIMIINELINDLAGNRSSQKFTLNLVIREMYRRQRGSEQDAGKSTITVLI